MSAHLLLVSSSIVTKPMSDKIFLDTNIVLYALQDDSRKKSIALHLIDERPCISTQVILECINITLKKLGYSKEKAFKNASFLIESCELGVIAESTLKRAFTISLRYQFSHWDSLIIASALEAGCQTLYSEDLKHEQVIDDRLIIINPFQ